MFNEIIGMLKETSRGKKLFIALVTLGYIIGVLASYRKLNSLTVSKSYCEDSVGPITCQPDEDCDRECLKYGARLVKRGGEAFYSYGILGAFLGGWLAVIVVTYIFKE